MVSAYVLIQTAANAPQVAHDVAAIEGVDSADDVSGPYDVIARVTAPDMDTLGRLVVCPHPDDRRDRTNADMPDRGSVTTLERSSFATKPADLRGSTHKVRAQQGLARA